VSERWKCGASRALPLVGDHAPWDGAAAASSIFKFCDFGGPNPDLEYARKAFLCYRPDHLEDPDCYLLPFGRIVRGELVAIRAGVANASRNLTLVPPDIRSKAAAVLDHYRRQLVDANPSAHLAAQDRP
jgi:hypothetical protein